MQTHICWKNIAHDHKTDLHIATMLLEFLGCAQEIASCSGTLH